jgi:hypothetical protein
MFVSFLTKPVVDRPHLPFAPVAFSAVVSLMPGFFLFNAAAGQMVSIDRSAPPALLKSIVAIGVTAFCISDHHGHNPPADPSAHAVRLAFCPHQPEKWHRRSMHRSAIQDYASLPPYPIP